MRWTTIAAAAFVSLAALCQARAQPPTPPPMAQFAGGKTLAATNSASAAAALPAAIAPYNGITLFNSGTKDAYWAIGGSGVAATTSPTGIGTGTNSGKIPAQTFYTVVANGGFISVITGGSDTTTVEVFQGNGPIRFGFLGAGGGGGAVSSVFGRTGAVTATSGDYTCAQVTNCAATNAVNTFTAAQINSTAGASATPAMLYSGAWFAGANAAQVLVQASGATAFNGGATGTGIGVNAAGTSTLIDAQLNGVSQFKVASNGAITSGSINIGSTTNITWNGRLSLTSSAAGTLNLGLADSASPVAPSLFAPSVATGNANTAGVTFGIRGSLSNGGGASGDVTISTGGTGASSGVQNTALVGLTIKGATATTGNPSVVLGNAALATNATDGFLYIASGAGTPTGTPTTFTGRVALYLDTTNSQIWAFMGGAWKQPKTPAAAAIVTFQ